MPTRPRREKRIHRQHDEQCCRWILFLWKRKARIRCACEKTGEARRWRSAPRAARPGRKKVGWRGMKKSGDALSKRAENRKSTQENRKTKGAQSKNKESPNQSAGAEIRKSEETEIRKRAGRESESVQFAHHLVEMKDSVDGIAFSTVFGVTGHEFQHRRIAGHAA